MPHSAKAQVGASGARCKDVLLSACALQYQFCTAQISGGRCLLVYFEYMQALWTAERETQSWGSAKRCIEQGIWFTHLDDL